MQLLEKVREPPKIRVVVRKRPLNSKEMAGAQDVCEILDERCMTVAEIKYVHSLALNLMLLL